MGIKVGPGGMDDAKAVAAPGVRWYVQPIQRLLILSFLLVALVPLGFLGFMLHEQAWRDAWREIHEKHKTLAKNLATPVWVYVQDHRATLELLANTLGQAAPAADPQTILSGALQYQPGFASLSLVASDDARLLYTTSETLSARDAGAWFQQADWLSGAPRRTESILSGVQLSPLSGQPAVFMAQPVHGADGASSYVLVGELNTELINQLRDTIQFGQNGHAMIIDQFGRIVAHPDATWVRGMRDLSDLDVVQAVLGGLTGVMEFYAPSSGTQMVAGYAALPDVNWGVLVVQPMAEVEAQVAALLRTQYMWSVVGLVLAILIGVALARWIARPLQSLARGAAQLVAQDFEGRLPETAAAAPLDVHQLRGSVNALVSGLQASRRDYDRLNRSLQEQIKTATEELRNANIQLAKQASMDYLTQLNNRRAFEVSLGEGQARRRAEDRHTCLLLLDVDGFKQVNDQYGHAAGDAVLVQLARILRERTRRGDLAARYGGDEFVIKMRCSREIGRQRAEDILAAIEAHEFRWRDRQLRVTVSIGLLYQESHRDIDLDELLQQVDQALYRAKQEGRNRCVEVAI